MINDTTLAVVAIVAALGLLGLVVIETINLPYALLSTSISMLEAFVLIHLEP